MTTITIPKKLIKDDLLIIERKRFEKQFDKLSKNLQKITARKIFLFENNPFHPGLNIHKLKGELSTFWSFYIKEMKLKRKKL